MNDNPTFSGIAPDHWPALIAALSLPLVVWYCVRALRRRAAEGGAWAYLARQRWAAAPEAIKWVAWLLGFTAVVHLALPIGHSDSPILTVLFLGTGAGYAVLAWRAVNGGRFRAVAVLLLLGNLVGYLIVVGNSAEEADQVGLATKVIELTALGLCLLPGLGPRRSVRRVLVRPIAASGFVLAVLVSGVVSWAQFSALHDDHHVADAAGQESEGEHSHGEYLARAQAGVILRPSAPAPNEEQKRAAARLAERTRAATAKYRDYHRAIADGFKATGPMKGQGIHFAKDANGKDGRLLDPQAPEQLVYAEDHGKILLVGVVYIMERAGVPGLEIGGSITRWHSHNACVTLLPPGFGIVSPYGTCPYASFTVTIPEMMHVWTVDPPGGPFVEHPDQRWVSDLVAREGLPL